jgi:hypothetical protein
VAGSHLAADRGGEKLRTSTHDFGDQLRHDTTSRVTTPFVSP